MEIKELKKRIAEADEDILEEIITEWMAGHEDFRKYLETKLCPAIDEIDFGYELIRKANRETKEFFQKGNYSHEATDWSNVYYDLVKPWSEQAESLPTVKLYKLVEEIITEVGMRITDKDFYGDDWYDDDFSDSIGEIMEALGNLAGLLLVREDFPNEMMISLEKLVKKAKKTDVIDNNIGGMPYDDILEMIDIRRETEEVTPGIYELMIDADYGSQGGKWLRRQIDFIRNMGMTQEAQNLLDDNLDYPAVCLKKYDELMTEGNWKAAVELLDEARLRKENNTMRYSPDAPNWLEMKQTLLDKYGTREEQIANLRYLFYSAYAQEDKDRYYSRMKSMVPPEDWRDFYHVLLSGITGYGALDTIAPFLIKEREWRWLYQLVNETEKKDATDYRTPLKYASPLSKEFHEETASQLVRTFRAYAADRFCPKKQVRSGKYLYFRDDLEKLGASGYIRELKELVEYLLVEYRFRPSLVKELKAIRLPKE